MSAVADRTNASTELGPAAHPAWAPACIEAFELGTRSFAVDGASAELALVGGRLELIGPAQLFEPGDLAYRDTTALSELVGCLRDAGRALALHRVPSSSPTIAALRERLPVVQRDAGACPVIHIDGDPEAALSSRRRSDLRRAQRRADAHGAVSVEVHVPGVEDVDELLDAAFAIEAQSWKGAAGTALLHDERRARFYRLLGRSLAAAGELRIAFLSIGDRPAAMQIAVERDGALWLLKIGYDERLAAASPGQLLMLATLRWAYEHDLQRYEFLGASAPWTQTWTHDERPCSAVFAYPLNHRGAVAFARDARRHLSGRAER
ncbi:MAG TPA: GNAT family N-acetyltransferase [Gaiellaceae bacterium]